MFSWGIERVEREHCHEMNAGKKHALLSFSILACCVAFKKALFPNVMGKLFQIQYSGH